MIRDFSIGDFEWLLCPSCNSKTRVRMRLDIPDLLHSDPADRSFGGVLEKVCQYRKAAVPSVWTARF